MLEAAAAATEQDEDAAASTSRTRAAAAPTSQTRGGASGTDGGDETQPTSSPPMWEKSPWKLEKPSGLVELSNAGEAPERPPDEGTAELWRDESMEQNETGRHSPVHDAPGRAVPEPSSRPVAPPPSGTDSPNNSDGRSSPHLNAVEHLSHISSSGSSFASSRKRAVSNALDSAMRNKQPKKKATVLEMLGAKETEEADHEDDDDFAFEDMRETVFPSHKAHRLVMNPLMEWRLHWDIAMMVLIVFVMIVTPFELAFVSSVPFRKNLDGKAAGLFYANWSVNFGFIVDIYFNLVTAVFDVTRNRWILTFSGIFDRYARTWLLLDVASIVPVEYMAGSEAKIIRLLRLFRLIKLARVLKSQKLVNNIAKHVDMSTKMQTVIKHATAARARRRRPSR